MSAWQIVLITLGALLLVNGIQRIVRKIHPFPAPSWLGIFLDSSYRRWVQPPDKMIERSGIEPGMTVLDLGCGSGAFATFVARVVGERGRVYAVDIEPKMLQQLKRKLARPKNRDIKNVELRRADAYHLPFEDEFFDAVCLVTVLFEVPDRTMALREIKRVLKLGGILAVTEFLPDPDYPLRSTVIKLGQSQGFILDENQGNLWNYTVRFRKLHSG